MRWRLNWIPRECNTTRAISYKKADWDPKGGQRRVTSFGDLLDRSFGRLTSHAHYLLLLFLFIVNPWVLLHSFGIHVHVHLILAEGSWPWNNLCINMWNKLLQDFHWCVTWFEGSASPGGRRPRSPGKTDVPCGKEAEAQGEGRSGPPGEWVVCGEHIIVIVGKMMAGLGTARKM